jgi:hypothetical protein
MKKTEFRLLIQILKENSNSYLWKFGIPALVNFQFHMIVGINNTTQFALENLRMHDKNVLKARLTCIMANCSGFNRFSFYLYLLLSLLLELYL